MQDITILGLVLIALAVNIGALCAIGTFLVAVRTRRFVRSHSIVSHDTLEALGFERYAGVSNIDGISFNWPEPQHINVAPTDIPVMPVVVTKTGKPDMRIKANQARFGVARE